MEILDITDLLASFNRRLVATPMEFHRYLYSKINWNDKLIGIKGPKGAGKSTLVLQHIKETFKGEDLEKVLYVSLDDLWFANNSIKDLVDYHYNNGGTHLFIDEIHYDKNWKRLIKNLCDNYPSLNIVYTGSSMLHIAQGENDLSRRQEMYELRGMSFREYLEYEYGIVMAPVALADLLTNHISIATSLCEKINILSAFNKYLSEGYYPFYKNVNNNIHTRLQAVVNQILDQDYPQIEDVTVSTIRKAKKFLMVVAGSVPQTPNMSAIFRELETDRNQGLKIMDALQRAGLILLLSDQAKSYDNLSRPEKIYVNNPTLMMSLNSKADIGAIRESFFFNQTSAVADVHYPPQGDFILNKTYVFEVGGKGKTFDQIADIKNSFLAVDNTEIGRKSRIPLWMFGLLY